MDTVSIVVRVLRRQSCCLSGPIPTSVSDPRPITQPEAINLRTSHLNSCSRTGPQHGDTRITQHLLLCRSHARGFCARACLSVATNQRSDQTFFIKINICGIYIYIYLTTFLRKYPYCEILLSLNSVSQFM